MTREKIAVIGLGYVGLPVAVALSEHNHLLGFDIDRERIESLRGGHDWTGEVSDAAMAESSVVFTHEVNDLRGCSAFIVTVPTPIDGHRRPDFGPLLSASKLVGGVITPGALIVYESTVFPGATEEICGPALESASGLARQDFSLGYSPERINPGDKEHRLESIVKVVAGQDAETTERVAAIYESVVSAGVHRAPSIRVAEAAKVIENTQRDVNIALMNELSLIFERMGIRTHDVLQAAGTKWNFLPFTPGLVGGHCIGVDPYYLTAKAEALGYHPEVILSGRRINDSMGGFVAQKLVKMLIAAERPVKRSKVLVLGLTFKEDVPDLRNSRVPDILRELRAFGVSATVCDPVANRKAALHEHGVELTPPSELTSFDAVVLAVPHRVLDLDMMQELVRPNGILVDVKSRLEPSQVRGDIAYWSL